MTGGALYEALAAAGVELDEQDRSVADWLGRQAPAAAEVVAAWIERAWPPDARRSHERAALTRIAERVRLAGADPGGERLALGVVLGMAEGGLRG